MMPDAKIYLKWKKVIQKALTKVRAFLFFRKSFCIFAKNNKDMVTIKDLNKAYEKVLDCENKLMCALEKLSVIASDLYGEELVANICNGSEIEFRTESDPDGLDSTSLRIEDIIERNKQ